jgi:uncharacterized protein (TIGR02246 family)
MDEHETPMFERFTEKARRVIFFARYEASEYGSKCIDTEHLLLGLLREDVSLARKFLCEQAGIETIREEIESEITRGERISTSVEIPLSEESKRILRNAGKEADRLGHKHIGTEHLLLAIFSEKDCLAARLLRERGLEPERLRAELARSSTASPVRTEMPGDAVSLSDFAEAWGSGSARRFADLFAAGGQFVDTHGNVWVGPSRIGAAAKLLFAAPGWAKCSGKIEDVQFVGAHAAMATLVWEKSQPSETSNPGCVRMTVILIQKPEGWTIARAQATEWQSQSRSAAG